MRKAEKGKLLLEIPSVIDQCIVSLIKELTQNKHFLQLMAMSKPEKRQEILNGIIENIMIDTDFLQSLGLDESDIAFIADLLGSDTLETETITKMLSVSEKAPTATKEVPHANISTNQTP